MVYPSSDILLHRFRYQSLKQMHVIVLEALCFCKLRFKERMDSEPLCQNVILLFSVCETAKYAEERTAVDENGNMRREKSA